MAVFNYLNLGSWHRHVCGNANRPGTDSHLRWTAMPGQQVCMELFSRWSLLEQTYLMPCSCIEFFSTTFSFYSASLLSETWSVPVAFILLHRRYIQTVSDNNVINMSKHCEIPGRNIISKITQHLKKISHRRIIYPLLMISSSLS